ncbi:MATE family efflux transporter [Intestinimonas timonensis]|uniref:MATE family efflux transporter n=1 Tax=Intestinimonas timonensis TaxID=1689270 RepID=UPI003A90E23E
MRKEKRENDLGRDPVGKLLLRLAVPTVTAQLVNALYNIVDRMYIGHIEGVGDLALTGLGICFPVIMFVSALSALVGMGGGSRAVVRMGSGDQEGASAILGSCATLLVILSVIFTAVLQLVKEPMLLLFGATENTLPYALDYLGIYLSGTIFVELSLGLNFFITAQGFSTVGMATVLIGAVVNIVLDPILIFGFGMGVKGAALATITAQAVSAVWVVCFLLGKRTKLRLQRRFARVDWKVLAPVLALGVSPFIMQSTESLVNIAFNSSLKAYGGDPAVGAMTICSSIMQVFYLLFQGLSQGGQPIVGYNYGAGNLDRVKQAFRLVFTCSLIFSTLSCLAIELFPGMFVAMFNDKPELVEIAVWTLRVYAAGMFMLGIQNSCQQTFVALGQAKISLFLALLRKIILLIPLIFILPHFIANKVLAVFLAEPAADILAALTTGGMFFWRFPKLLRAREAELKEQSA